MLGHILLAVQSVLFVSYIIVFVIFWSLVLGVCSFVRCQVCCAHLSVSLQVLVPPRGFATFVTFILSQEGRGSNTVGSQMDGHNTLALPLEKSLQICENLVFG